MARCSCGRCSLTQVAYGDPNSRTGDKRSIVAGNRVKKVTDPAVDPSLTRSLVCPSSKVPPVQPACKYIVCLNLSSLCLFISISVSVSVFLSLCLCLRFLAPRGKKLNKTLKLCLCLSLWFTVPVDFIPCAGPSFLNVFDLVLHHVNKNVYQTNACYGKKTVFS